MAIPHNTALDRLAAELRGMAVSHPYVTHLINHIELAGSIYPVHYPDVDLMDVLRHPGERQSTDENSRIIGVCWSCMLSRDDLTAVQERIVNPEDPLELGAMGEALLLILSFFRDQAATDGTGYPN